MSVYLHGVQYHLPAGARTNEELVRLNPSWDAQAIQAKTGIRQRRVANAEETASDLACRAAQRLLDESGFDRAQIDALIFCTQSPDYYLPTSACLLQSRLGLPTSCAAFDVNLGCSAFTYGLWLARALILGGEASHVLLLVGDTLSRYCSPHDLATVTLFADGGGAALLSNRPQGAVATIGASVVGTDGRGGPNLIVPTGGARCPRTPSTAIVQDHGKDSRRSRDHLFMNGPEIFSFTLQAVPAGIEALLKRVGWTWDDVDYFLLHQANRFMLEQLRKRMKIPAEKMPIDLENYGNTASATLPTLLRDCADKGMLQPGARCVLAGFGVGYSWAMTAMTWLT